MKKHLRLFIILMFIGLGIYTEQHFSVKKHPKKTDPLPVKKIELPVELIPKQGGIVFMGTSLTAFFHLRMLGFDGLVNRGIQGDYVKDMPKRIDEIIALKPSRLFVEGGVNDIMSDFNYSEFIWYYEKMIKRVCEKSPKTKIYIQSILPVHYYPNMYLSNSLFNEHIREENDELRMLAKRYNVTFINLYPLFESGGEMNKSLTTDGVHLTLDGYLLWTNALLPYLYQR